MRRSDGTGTLGVMGGTFDPPHVGHVLLATMALGSGEIDALLVVPAWRHPFGKRPRAAFEERLRMCELAFAPLRGVRVTDLERRLGGTSRTVRTLQALHEQHPDARLRLVLGADTWAQLEQWAEPERVRTLAPPLVFGRAGHPLPPGRRVALPAVSSTEVRELLRRGAPVDDLLPAPVARLAESLPCYRRPEGESR